MSKPHVGDTIHTTEHHMTRPNQYAGVVSEVVGNKVLFTDQEGQPDALIWQWSDGSNPWFTFVKP